MIHPYLMAKTLGITLLLWLQSQSIAQGEQIAINPLPLLPRSEDPPVFLLNLERLKNQKSPPIFYIL